MITRRGDCIIAERMRSESRRFDKLRAKNHDLLCSYRWGNMRGYELCLNASYLEIKKIIHSVAQYAADWFAK